MGGTGGMKKERGGSLSFAFRGISRTSIFLLLLGFQNCIYRIGTRMVVPTTTAIQDCGYNTIGMATNLSLIDDPAFRLALSLASSCFGLLRGKKKNGRERTTYVVVCRLPCASSSVMLASTVVRYNTLYSSVRRPFLN